MSRLLRTILVASLIAFHAAVTTCAAGLHALPGLGHDSGLSPFAKGDHSHGPGKSTHSAAEECPVCQFLAQGQISPEHSDHGSDRLVVADAETVPAPASLSTPPLPSAPRAPPTAIAG